MAASSPVVDGSAAVPSPTSSSEQANKNARAAALEAMYDPPSRLEPYHRLAIVLLFLTV